MRIQNGFVMTIDDSDDVNDLDMKFDLDSGFKFELGEAGQEQSASNGEVEVMDFSLARGGLGKSAERAKYKTIDQIIEEKRKRNIEEEGESEEDEVQDVVEEEGKENDSVEKSTKKKIKLDENDKQNKTSEKTKTKGAGKKNGNKKYESEDDSSDSSDSEDEAEKQRKKEYFADQEDESVENDGELKSFAEMHLSRSIMKGLTQLGIAHPTKIQSKTIPIALLGKDICGSAVTGSGKTAAFLVPVLERLLFRPPKVAKTRVLIMAPTRELAMQVHNVAVKLAEFTDIKMAICVGGLSLKAQEVELKKRPDIVIGTPGRLIDHVRNTTGFSLDGIEILVMDEADRMLEDGFKEELTQIIQACPKKRQTLLFSATMTDSVDQLVRLSLNKPYRIQVDPPKQTSAKLVQEFVRVRREAERPAILAVLCKRYYTSRTIIFFQQKALAHQMKILFGLFGLNAAELHGSLSQEQRMEALEKFRDHKVDFLLATDVASRGLDIRGIQTVINYTMPMNHEVYLHRVGRTARAGRSGKAVSLVGKENNDRKVLKKAIKASSANNKQQQQQQQQLVQVHKSVVKQRVMNPDLIAKYISKIDGKFKPQIDEILEEEKQAKKMAELEMQITKSENLILHDKEIKSRPRRTWFK